MSYFQNQGGIECSILTINQGIDDTLIEYLSGIEIVALPYISSRFQIPVPMIGIIAKLVRSADVVHLMNHWSVLNVFVYLFIKLLKKPRYYGAFFMRKYSHIEGAVASKNLRNFF